MEDTGVPVDRRGPGPAPGGVPRRHHLQDPLPREPGSARPRAHAVGLPEVLRGRRRAAAVDPAPAARALPATEGHQGPPAGWRRSPDRRRARPEDGAAAPPGPAHPGRRSRYRPRPSRPTAGRPEAGRAALGLRRARTGAGPAPAPAHRRRRPPAVVHLGPPGALRAAAAVVDPSGESLTLGELAAASGLDEDLLVELEKFGLLVGRKVAQSMYYDDEALLVATLAAGFMHYGVEARHLRMYKTAAEREAGFFEQVVMPMLKQRNPEARKQATEALAELTRLGQGLRAAMLGSPSGTTSRGKSPSAGLAPAPRVLIPAEDLAAGAARVAAEISAAYDDGVLLVAVLKGSVPFLADLARHLTLVPLVDFLAISSYAPDTGRVRIVKDLEIDIHGRDVVLVEDIVDTGLTLTYLLRRARRAAAAVARGLHAPRQGGPADRPGAHPLPGLRDRRRVRHRLRPRLRPALPQPRLRRGGRPGGSQGRPRCIRRDSVQEVTSADGRDAPGWGSGRDAHQQPDRAPAGGRRAASGAAHLHRGGRRPPPSPSPSRASRHRGR